MTRRFSSLRLRLCCCATLFAFSTTSFLRIEMQRIIFDTFAFAGIPFHPLGEKPSAPCPLCFAERADSSRKLLFGIVGAGMDEHDQDVPAAYFQMPPTKLGGNSPSSCGMRVSFRASSHTLSYVPTFSELY